MKKTFALVIAIWILACIVGCSQPQEEIPTVPEEYSLTCRDARITMKAPASPVLEVLGEPVRYTEETSCAFDGLDKTYYYGSFYLTTYPDVDGDRISSLWFADDTMTTAEGIAIGNTRDEVERVYGREAFNGANAFILKQGESTLTVILTEDKVSGIRYDAVFASLG